MKRYSGSKDGTCAVRDIPLTATSIESETILIMIINDEFQAHVEAIVSKLFIMRSQVRAM